MGSEQTVKDRLVNTEHTAQRNRYLDFISVLLMRFSYANLEWQRGIEKILTQIAKHFPAIHFKLERKGWWIILFLPNALELVAILRIDNENTVQWRDDNYRVVKNWKQQLAAYSVNECGLEMCACVVRGPVLVYSIREDKSVNISYVFYVLIAIERMCLPQFSDTTLHFVEFHGHILMHVK